MALTTEQQIRYFGPVTDYPTGKGVVASKMTTVTTPWGIKARVHVLIAAVFLEACREAHATVAWRPQRIDSFAPRPIRGSKKMSKHALALAVDFFATKPNVPPPGGVWTPVNPVPPEFAACFTRRGFRWGATFERVDLPHIEWPGAPPAAQPQEDDDDMDAHGHARMAMRTYLGRNPNNQGELDAHAEKLVKVGLDVYCRDLADSDEGKAFEQQVNVERAAPDKP